MAPDAAAQRRNPFDVKGPSGDTVMQPEIVVASIDGEKLGSDLGVPVLSGPNTPSGPNPPPGPNPTVRVPVAVALGDSFISGQGAGDYVRTGQPWGGSIEDVDYCDRSAYASIHVANLIGIDQTYNVACSGASISDFFQASGARAGLASQLDQLIAIASSDDEQVELIQIAAGVNNSDFYFGTLLEACISGFIQDGFTHSGFALSFSDNQWYDWASDGGLGGGDTEGLYRSCSANQMPVYFEAAQTRSVSELRAALRHFSNALGNAPIKVSTATDWPFSFDHPADEVLFNTVRSYIDDLDDAWFGSEASEVPMMALPYPNELAAAITSWEDTHAPRSSRLSDPFSLRAIRLVHLWGRMLNRDTWGPMDWNADISDIGSRLEPLANAAGIAESLRFPPVFKGEQLPLPTFWRAMWLPKTSPPSSMVFGQSVEISGVLSELVTRMAQISDNGVSRYPPGSYRIVVQDYASPFSPTLAMAPGNDSTNKFVGLVQSRYAAGCPVHEDTAAWALSVAADLSMGLDQAVQAFAVQNPGHDVVRLNVLHALDGGRLCESSSASLVAPIRFADWLPTGVDVLSQISSTTILGLRDNERILYRCNYWEYQVCQDSAHPNRSGHYALGQCLAAAWQSSVATLDCDRINNAMHANGVPISIVDPRPRVEGVLIGETQQVVTSGGESELCQYVGWTMTVRLSVVDPGETGTWGSAAWTVDAVDADLGSVSVSSLSNDVVTLSGQAPCVPWVDVVVSIAATATVGTDSTTGVGVVSLLIGETGGPA